MQDKPSRIEPVKLDIPNRISAEPTPTIDKTIPAKRNDLHEAGQAMQHEIDNAKGYKKTIKEKTMTALLNQLLAFVKTWLYGRPVYKTFKGADGTAQFLLDKDGNKVMNIPLTILGRLLQLLGAFGLLSTAVWGKSFGEWAEIIKAILLGIG